MAKTDSSPAPAAPVERRFAIRAFPLPNDKFNIVRKRVLLTPATCDVCGFDVAERNAAKLGVTKVDFDSLSGDVQAALTDALKEHKRRQHTVAELQVVTESQLERSWLSKEGKKPR